MRTTGGCKQYNSSGSEGVTEGKKYENEKSTAYTYILTAKAQNAHAGGMFLSKTEEAAAAAARRRGGGVRKTGA